MFPNLGSMVMNPMVESAKKKSCLKQILVDHRNQKEVGGPFFGGSPNFW